MRVTMLLADSAQAVNGKLYVLGGGWTSIADQAPMAIAIVFGVPWDQANTRHRWALRLVDQDGNPVEIATPDGNKPIEVSGEFEAGRPPGVVRGSELSIPVAVNLAAFPLPKSASLEWRLFINDEAQDDWRRPFQTKP